MKIKRHILGRFIKWGSGSDRLRPLHGARHFNRQIRSVMRGRANASIISYKNSK